GLSPFPCYDVQNLIPQLGGDAPMKLVPLGIFALVINLGNTAHAACMDTRCTEERPVTASQTNNATLGARIDYCFEGFGDCQCPRVQSGSRATERALHNCELYEPRTHEQHFRPR